MPPPLKSSVVDNIYAESRPSSLPIRLPHRQIGSNMLIKLEAGLSQRRGEPVDFQSCSNTEHYEIYKIIKSLEETGLQNFLDDKHTIYPESILEFFYHARVFRGSPHFETHIQSKVGGIVFDFTERDFARCFSLPKHGITDLEVSADIKAEISIAFARSDEPVEDHGTKSRLRAEYQLLNDVIGGRKKKADKKAAPAKAKAESKRKETVTFSEPPQQTEDEESASFSERTDTEKTEDDRSVNEDDHSAHSPNDVGPNTNPETTEGGKEGGEEGVKKRAETIEELYLEWHDHRYGTPYREILPGHTDVECIQRLEEVEDLIMNLTNSNTLQKVQHRTCLLKPKVQLRKLTTRIRKITEELKTVGPEDTLAPRVLERLEKAKGELTQEIERLEAICSRMKIPVYTAPRIDTSPDHCPTPPRENAASKDSDERADPNLTGQSPPPQPEVSASDFTKEWVEGHLQRLEDSTAKRIDNRIQEFEDSAVQPFKDRVQRITGSALKFADTTWFLLNSNRDRISEVDEDLQEEAALRGKYVKRTEILEDLTSELKGDFDRLERETDQRLTSMSDDLVGTTLDRVSELEKKNVDLVAELKALSEQVAEMLRVKDALDAEISKEKEAPRSSQLTEKEAEAERIKRAEAIFPGLTKKAAAQAAEDAERLERRNKTLKEVARFMLADSGVSQRLWAEAINTASEADNDQLSSSSTEEQASMVVVKISSDEETSEEKSSSHKSKHSSSSSYKKSLPNKTLNSIDISEFIKDLCDEIEGTGGESREMVNVPRVSSPDKELERSKWSLEML
ncbi:calponin homology domain-containing protein DDB_G0272472-like [Impatiens glandulifera]|uniref:calponin homology domain-containing protein DDB_G0272472-like n=1 Tax=Impatiens glandulifera TaxID=253017 RepID=UPI001FB1104C|nr:calponin homology domain-containing protein DDB_G0272472-like [Impatiens glandulifera]